MASSLFSFKNLLLVTGSKLSFADYLSLTVLVEVLQHAGITIDLAGINPLPDSYTQAVPFPKVKKLDKMPARKFVLTFDKSGDSVKNVQWQQTDQKVSIHISMEKGQFKADGMNITAEGANYEAVLYYKVGNFAEVEPFFTEFPTAVYELSNLSLGEKFSIDNAKVEILDSESIANLPENIYSLVKGQGSTADQHTRLLAAIFDATRRFRTGVSKGQTFTRCAELLNSGADLEQANALVEKAKPESKPNAKQSTEPLPIAKPNNSHTAAQIQKSESK